MMLDGLRLATSVTISQTSPPSTLSPSSLHLAECHDDFDRNERMLMTCQSFIELIVC